MTTPARTQKQRRDEAEAALLNAAAELVAEQGLRSLTLARVGARAGLQPGPRHALLRLQAGPGRTPGPRGPVRLRPGPGGRAPGLDRLLRLIDGYLAQQAKHERPLNKAFLLLWIEAATSPDLAPSSTTARRPSAGTCARTSRQASPRARSTPASPTPSTKRQPRSSPNSAAWPSNSWSTASP